MDGHSIGRWLTVELDIIIEISDTQMEGSSAV